MQNICVFICLLKDVEGILSIHTVVSPGSTKSLGTGSWLQENLRKQEKNKPSEVILWAEVSNKTWFFVNGDLCLTGVPNLKFLTQLQHLCGQMSAPTPVAGSQGVALGLGSKGGCCCKLCGFRSLSCHPPTFAERAKGELSLKHLPLSCIWFKSGEGWKVWGHLDADTHAVTAGVMLLSNLCHLPDSNSCIFMCNRSRWWWWCLVKIINLILNPHLSESSCKSRG